MNNSNEKCSPTTCTAASATLASTIAGSKAANCSAANAHDVLCAPCMVDLVLFLRSASASEIDEFDDRVKKMAAISNDPRQMHFAKFVHGVAITIWGSP